MGSSHRHLDRLASEGGDGHELINQTEVDVIGYRATADRRRMRNIRIVLGYRLGFGFTLKGWNLLPEMVQHRIGRRVTVMAPAMHFPARDHIDPGDLLL